MKDGPSNLTDGSTLIVGHTPVVNLMDEENAEEAGRSNFWQAGGIYGHAGY